MPTKHAHNQPDPDTLSGGCCCRRRRRVLGGPLLACGLLLGPAQVALHLDELWGVLLLLLNFLLLQLQLQKETLTKTYMYIFRTNNFNIRFDIFFAVTESRKFKGKSVGYQNASIVAMSALLH